MLRRPIVVQSYQVELTWHDLAVTQESRTLLAPCSGYLPPQSLGVIIGHSGSGKSTLLKAIAHLFPFQGKVTVKDTQQQALCCDPCICYMDQGDALWPCLTVLEQLEAWDRWSHHERLEREAKSGTVHMTLEQIMDLLHLSHVAHRRVGDGLSGGERRRLNLACLLLKRPHVLLLDEPTSSLSSSDALLVMRVMFRIVQQLGISILTVLHQPRADMLPMMNYVGVIHQSKCLFWGPTDAWQSWARGWLMSHHISMDDPHSSHTHENICTILLDQLELASLAHEEQSQESGQAQGPLQIPPAIVVARDNVSERLSLGTMLQSSSTELSWQQSAQLLAWNVRFLLRDLWRRRVLQVHAFCLLSCVALVMSTYTRVATMIDAMSLYVTTNIILLLLSFESMSVSVGWRQQIAWDVMRQAYTPRMAWCSATLASYVSFGFLWISASLMTDASQFLMGPAQSGVPPSLMWVILVSQGLFLLHLLTVQHVLTWWRYAYWARQGVWTCWTGTGANRHSFPQGWAGTILRAITTSTGTSSNHSASGGVMSTYAMYVLLCMLTNLSNPRIPLFPAWIQAITYVSPHRQALEPLVSWDYNHRSFQPLDIWSDESRFQSMFGIHTHNEMIRLAQWLGLGISWLFLWACVFCLFPGKSVSSMRTE